MHKKNFDDNFEKIIDTLKNLQLDVKSDMLTTGARMTSAQKQNPEIAKFICENIACGYSPSESVTIAALRYDCTLKRARAIYEAHKNATACAVAFAKNYLIKTLKRRGFKIDDIALILNCSRQTVYNYLKKGCLEA